MERSKRSVFAGFFIITILVILLVTVVASSLESSCQAQVAISESVAKTGSRGNVWDGEWEIEPASQGGSNITLSRNCG